MQSVCYFCLMLTRTEIQRRQTDMVKLVGVCLQILIVNVPKTMYLKRKYFCNMRNGYGRGPNAT